MIIITIAYFAAAIAVAYWLGNRGAGYGIVAFIVAVFIWQVAVDGPSSLLERNGCERYSAIAQDC